MVVHTRVFTRVAVAVQADIADQGEPAEGEISQISMDAHLKLNILSKVTTSRYRQINDIFLRQRLVRRLQFARRSYYIAVDSISSRNHPDHSHYALTS